MSQMSAEAGGDNSGGPMWGRFFESIGGHDDESMISGSGMPTDINTPPPYPESPLRLNLRSPEVGPNDSASVMDDDAASGIDFPSMRRGVSSLNGSLAVPASIVDDGTYVFKFSTPSKRTHRFQARHDDVEHLREIIIGKLETDPFFTAPATDGDAANVPVVSDFQMYYKDADGDNVYISSSEDMSDAVTVARNARVDRVVLYLHGGSSWDVAKSEPMAETKPAMPTEVSAATPAPELVSGPPIAEEMKPTKAEGRSQSTSSSDEVFGIPRDMILPASIGALAVVIVAIFTISRLSD